MEGPAIRGEGRTKGLKAALDLPTYKHKDWRGMRRQ